MRDKDVIASIGLTVSFLLILGVLFEYMSDPKFDGFLEGVFAGMMIILIVLWILIVSVYVVNRLDEMLEAKL